MDQVLEHALQKMPIEIEWDEEPIMPAVIWVVIMAVNLASTLNKTFLIGENCEFFLTRL